MTKSHLLFRNTSSGPAQLKFKSRSSGEKNNEEDQEEQTFNWEPQQGVFRTCRDNLISDRNQRIENRDTSLDIPANIEYISITFWDAFNTRDYEKKYINDFGLQPIKYSRYNSVVLFAVINQDKFNYFIKQIELYINSDDPRDEPDLDKKVIFIREFEFLTTNKIKQYDELKEYLKLNLIDDPFEIETALNEIIQSLNQHLSSLGFQYNINERNRNIEIVGIDQDSLNYILDNFDVFHSVNSPRTGLVIPSKLNVVQRTYGFNISNATEELPIIGVLDTGISDQTPLKDIIINTDESFDLTGTNAKIDNADHGTGVAAFAALGNKLIIDETSTELEADAKLLSMKIADSSTGHIVESDVINLIKTAHEELGVRIFTLNISYEDAKLINSSISEYAYNLDLLAHELGILIIISTGNFNDDKALFESPTSTNLKPYPQQFNNESTTLNEPADSYNNLIVGASASNFEKFDLGNNHSPEPNYPASYTRRFYHDHSAKFFLGKNGGPNYQRINKQLVKPDIIFPGGNYDHTNDCSSAGLNILLNDVSVAFDRYYGTSYSAPLIANLAAKIIKEYPDLSMQTVKSLIVNSADQTNFDKRMKNELLFNSYFINGKGVAGPDIAMFSSDSIVTMVLEDEIKPKEIKSYPIKLPEYLNNSTKDKRGILKISSTLCFSFEPVYGNHLAYCPLDISFGIFKNLELDDSITGEYNKNIPVGLNGNSVENISFRESWSQDYYWLNKQLSNCQKISFNALKKDLIAEDNTFKLAIRSQLHKLLPLHLKEHYNKPHKFSLAIRIEDISGVEGNLYDEIQLVNSLQVISDLEAEIDLEN